MDSDYWKHAYKDLWARTSERVKRVAARIAEDTGRTCSPIGLGALSDAFLPGTAEQQGFEKGAADLRVDGTNVVVEVTGPNSKNTTATQPLWLRPDKIDAARRHPELQTCVVHVLERDDLMRVVHLGKAFFAEYDGGRFPVEEKVIRGRQERYAVIPAAHPYVRRWVDFTNWLKNGGGDPKETQRPGCG